MVEEIRLDKQVENAIIEISKQLRNLNRLVAAIGEKLFGARIKEIEESEKDFEKIVKRRRG